MEILWVRVIYIQKKSQHSKQMKMYVCVCSLSEIAPKLKGQFEPISLFVTAWRLHKLALDILRTQKCYLIIPVTYGLLPWRQRLF